LNNDLNNNWINPTLSALNQHSVTMLLDYAAVYAPGWLDGDRPSLNISVGAVVLAVLAPLTDDQPLAIIVGKVLNIGDMVTVQPIATRGPVGEHCGDDWSPGQRVDLVREEVYQITDLKAGAGDTWG